MVRESYTSLKLIFILIQKHWNLRDVLACMSGPFTRTERQPAPHPLVPPAWLSSLSERVLPIVSACFLSKKAINSCKCILEPNWDFIWDEKRKLENILRKRETPEGGNGQFRNIMSKVEHFLDPVSMPWESYSIHRYEPKRCDAWKPHYVDKYGLFYSE